MKYIESLVVQRNCFIENFSGYRFNAISPGLFSQCNVHHAMHIRIKRNFKNAGELLIVIDNQEQFCGFKILWCSKGILAEIDSSYLIDSFSPNLFLENDVLVISHESSLSIMQKCREQSLH